MKPYSELTRLGRLRRLRRLAQAALEAYGLDGARLTFIQYEGNLVYRVDLQGSSSERAQGSPYLENRYLLRILTSSDMEYVASELTWLSALSQAGLPVPNPVLTQEGQLLTRITTPGVPGGKIISLMHWIDGRRLTKGFHPHHFHALGMMVARLHEFSACWQPPEGFSRPDWDWEGQLGGREFRYPVEELVAAMPASYQEPFQVVSEQVRQVTQNFGKGTDAYGLIHSDLYPENVLFKGREVFPIDFEDCGYGYWMWDIAIALCYWPWTEEWYWMRDAFLKGYAQIRILPESQLRYLDLFMAAQYATMVLWSTMFIQNDPAMRGEYEAWRGREGTKLLLYTERR
ncbi:MAG: phosphotransferase enzyme family protein [Anaerolineales bacterium]